MFHRWIFHPDSYANLAYSAQSSENWNIPGGWLVGCLVEEDTFQWGGYLCRCNVDAGSESNDDEKERGLESLMRVEGSEHLLKDAH